MKSKSGPSSLVRPHCFDSVSSPNQSTMRPCHPKPGAGAPHHTRRRRTGLMGYDTPADEHNSTITISITIPFPSPSQLRHRHILSQGCFHPHPRDTRSESRAIARILQCFNSYRPYIAITYCTFHLCHLRQICSFHLRPSVNVSIYVHKAKIMKNTNDEDGYYTFLPRRIIRQ